MGEDKIRVRSHIFAIDAGAEKAIRVQYPIRGSGSGDDTPWLMIGKIAIFLSEASARAVVAAGAEIMEAWREHAEKEVKA